MTATISTPLQELLDPPAPRSRTLGRRSGRIGPIAARLTLALIALVQVALAWRPGLQTTPFQDEGLYIYMGHRMIDHVVHGTAVIEHPGAYFSGAPGFYPILAALGDNVAGLAGARAVSLLFAIAAMIAVYGLTAELFGRLAGLFGAAAFAVNGSVIFQSHLATYDSTMLALLVAAAWLAVRSARRDGLLWAPAVGVLLTAAIFAKYAAIGYVVVVAALGAAAGWRRFRWLVVRRAAFVVFATAAMTYFVLELFARDLIRGIVSTTMSRQPIAPTSTHDLLDAVIRWSAAWYLLAILGALILARRQLPVAAVLLAGSMLGAADQIRIHEATSLAKQLAFGMAFAAPLIGNLLAAASRRLRPLVAVAVVAVLGLGLTGYSDSGQFLTGWVSDAPLRAPLRTAIALNPHKTILGEEPSAQRYELQGVVQPWQWTDTWSFHYDSLSGDAAYAEAINQSHFGVIYLNLKTTHGRWIHSYLTTHSTPYQLLSKPPRYLRGHRIGEWLVYVPRVS